MAIHVANTVHVFDFTTTLDDNSVFQRIIGVVVFINPFGCDGYVIVILAGAVVSTENEDDSFGQTFHSVSIRFANTV